MKIKPLVRRRRIADLDGLSIDPHDDPLVLHLLANVASVEVAVFDEASDGVDVAVPLHDDTGEAFAVDRAGDDTFLLAFFEVKRGLCLGWHLAHHQHQNQTDVPFDVHDVLQSYGVETP